MIALAQELKHVHALREIIPLHSVFMRRAVGEVRKAQLPQLVIFELPVILQFQSHMIADRPVIIFPFDGIVQRTSL